MIWRYAASIFGPNRQPARSLPCGQHEKDSLPSPNFKDVLP